MANTNEYMSSYMKLRRIKRREKIISYLGGKCCKCGLTINLEINHINPKEKSYNIGKIQDSAWEKILGELKKCELLCKQHHLEATRQQYKDGLLPPPWNKNTSILLHGSARMYSEMKCRCNSCKTAKILYRNKKIKYSEAIK